MDLNNDVMDFVKLMKAMPPCVAINSFDEILKDMSSLNSSIEEPPKLELKPLPIYIKFIIWEMVTHCW